MDDEKYKLEIEKRLSTLETNMANLMQTAQTNNKTITKMEIMVARLTLLVPALSAAAFIIGVLIGRPTWI